MLTLAMDTATKTIGLALLEDEEILAELFLNLGRHHAEVLLPALDRICSLAGTPIGSIDLIACTIGPGSFTGVRIGASTVKGLALATGKPVVGVSTLEALAFNALPRTALICPMLDARRNQVYTGLYREGKNGLPEPVGPELLIDVDTFLKGLEEETVFLGDGAVRYERLIGETRPGRFTPAGARHQGIRAAAVGLIGLERHREGRVLNPLTFSPRYLRLSEAEVSKQTCERAHRT
jgi:tRNA threonylcarbamoyladenosine biosynthesis protein TsaB